MQHHSRQHCFICCNWHLLNLILHSKHNNGEHLWWEFISFLAQSVTPGYPKLISKFALKSKAALEEEVESLKLQNACLLHEVQTANEKDMCYLEDLPSAELDLCLHKDELLSLPLHSRLANAILFTTIQTPPLWKIKSLST